MEVAHVVVSTPSPTQPVSKFTRPESAIQLNRSTVNCNIVSFLVNKYVLVARPMNSILVIPDLYVGFCEGSVDYKAEDVSFVHTLEAEFTNPIYTTSTIIRMIIIDFIYGTLS